MASPASPLQAIHQKELELQRRVAEARRQAEARTQAAHEEAERTIAQADEDGRAAAEACYQQGIAQARREAEAIVAAAQEEALDLRRRAVARLDKVAGQIVALVLPTGQAPA